jgi:hypothetical protein
MPEFREKVWIKDVVVIKRTDKAALCLIEEDEVWIPQSQIDDDSEVWDEGDEGTLVISQWIADQKKIS